MPACASGEKAAGWNMDEKKREPESHVTIYDIAKAAGVAPGTVSRTVNNIGYIKDETRKRIEAAMAELKYTPNRAARTLKTKRTGLILLAIPYTDNPFYVDMIKAVQENVKNHGYSMILTYTEGKIEEEIRALKMLHEHYADGMILINFSFTPRHSREIERIHAPLVLSSISKSSIGGRVGDNFDYVGVDTEKAVLLSTRHLVQQGHSRIAYYAGLPSIELYQERLAGFKSALSEGGLPYREECILWGSYKDPKTFEMVCELMKKPDPPTAVVCANDMLALGAMLALQDAGYRVPEDVSLVGMDNIDTTLRVRPMLSTVAIAQAEIGRFASELLFRRLNREETGGSVKRIFEPRLIVRGSSTQFSSASED